MATIGVLALQGAVEEHIHMIEAAGLKGIPVKRPEQLDEIDGLILPGGESTTMRKLIDTYEFVEPIRNFSRQEKPIFGTCAGLVLLAKTLSGSTEAHLQLMDIRVKRNAFGRQQESFEAPVEVKGFDTPFPAVFIRAPIIEEAGEKVEVLATFDHRIVAAKQGHLLTTAFHPELTGDLRFIRLFANMVTNRRESLPVKG